MNSRMIPEVQKFLETDGNTILLIRGEAGTGKTIFSLELVNFYAKMVPAFYFTSRVDVPSLFGQFPWIRENIGEDLIFDITRSSARRIKKHKLEFSFSTIQEFLQNIYLLLEEAGMEKKKVVVIDSIDALSELFDLPMNKIITGLQDVAINANTKFIVISETVGAKDIEYLSDGVITLIKEYHDNRILRSLIIDKLRGVEVKSSIYFFTLKDGRIMFLENYPMFISAIDVKAKHPIINDREGSRFFERNAFSTGNNDFDKIIKGYQKGSFVVFQVDKTVIWSNILDIVSHTVENFLLQNRGVIIVPTSGFSPIYFRNMFSRLVGPEVFEENCIVFMPGLHESTEYKWLKSVSPTPEDVYNGIMDTYNDFTKRFKEVLVLLGMDFFEAYFGPQQTERIVMKIISIVKIDQNLAIGLVNQDSPITTKLVRMSDYIFNVFSRSGKLFMYGVLPATNILNINLDVSGPHPITRYIEIL